MFQRTKISRIFRPTGTLMFLTIENILAILNKQDLEKLINTGDKLTVYEPEAQRIFNSLKCLNYHPEFKYVKELVEYVYWTAFSVKLDGEEIVPRDFYPWLKQIDLKTMVIALDICELLDGEFYDCK